VTENSTAFPVHYYISNLHSPLPVHITGSQVIAPTELFLQLLFIFCFPETWLLLSFCCVVNLFLNSSIKVSRDCLPLCEKITLVQSSLNYWRFKNFGFSKSALSSEIYAWRKCYSGQSNASESDLLEFIGFLIEFWNKVFIFEFLITGDATTVKNCGF
jgi:hypothetical protein